MAIKKISYIKLILLIGLFSIGSANRLLASHEVGTNRLSSPNVTMGNMLYIQDSKYASIASMPSITTWGFYDVTFSNKIILGIDRYMTVSIPDFVATVTVQISSTVPLALGGGTSVITQTLSLKHEGVNDHHSSAPNPSIDQAVFVYTNGYKSTIKITGISVTSSVFGTSTTLPQNVYLQAETDAERFYTLPQNVSPFINSNDVIINYISASDELEVSWARIVGAEQYDLEWLWLDGEKNVFWNNTPTINFKNNSTRIRTSQQSYRISNVFEKGQVFFRLRGVGKSGLIPNTYTKDAYTPWSWQDITTIPTGVISSLYSVTAPSSGADYLFYVTIDGITPATNGLIPIIHESNKNWQYKSTYAEEGKKKEVISYFDGTLRSRQSVTKNNSDNNAIVGETYYDYNGRGAVQALPVPVPDATIKFYQYNVSGKSGFNIDINSHLPYDKKVFDEDASSNTTVCSVLAVGLDPGYGASRYYSPNSSFINQFAQGYVPDAENFPISQTEFTNDNTGRISKQGGVGKTHQLGSGHETKYFYGMPDQVELDRLFGSEVGFDKHYKKNMVVDANGQVSISYIDQEGRTIATALSGQSPANLDPLKDKNGEDLYLPPSATNVLTTDLLNKVNSGDFDTNKDNNSRIGDKLTFSKKILVPTASTYTISYDLQGTSYTYSCLSSNPCYDCVYDLEIDVYDNCLNNPNGFTKITKTLGKMISPTQSSTVLDALCNQVVNFSTTQLSNSGSDLQIYLEQGEYTITKTLKINQNAMTFYLNDYLKSNCVKTINDFKQGIAPDTSGCGLTCDECIAALGTQTAYVASGKGSNEDWLNEYKICREPCDYVSICDAEYITMLADVSPGGQYGDWEDNNGACNTSLFDLSVYNEANKLPNIKNFTIGYIVPNWRHPYNRTSVYTSTTTADFTSNYYDDNGSVSKVFVTRVPAAGATPVYFPPVVSGALVTPVITGNTNVGDQFYVKPQDLANVSDFIASWKNSWAPSLVFYHPEYAYYDWCLKNSTMKISSPYPVTIGTGTTATTNTVYTSDNYDSLLLVTDDIVGLLPADLAKLGSPLLYDPYWTTNGYYYNNISTPTSAVGSRVAQYNNSVITLPLTSPWNALFMNAKTRYNSYQNSGASLPTFAALITTSCSIQYGQPINSQLTCLVGILNMSSGPTITVASVNSMTADDIMARLPLNLRNKFWDNFRMMYLALKQGLQQEAAESYAMNGDYRGCNDGIGDPAFDPMSLQVPFTQYFIFAPVAYLSGTYVNQFFNQWFFPIPQPNEPQYSNVFFGPMYNSKIKRFPNAKNATDLSNNLSNGDPGASIYANTGLCPNAFYFQNLLNSLGVNNQLTSTTLNLSTIPEFNKDLYTVVANGVIPSSFTPANWTSTNSALTLSAAMQIGSNPSCPLTINFPSGYPFNFTNTGNGGTYSFLKLYRLTPGTGSGSSYNFTIKADVAFSSGSSQTFTTVILSGTTCIPLTGCSFTQPCEPTTTAILMQKLLNAIAATGSMCSGSVLMSNQTMQPYFLNSFGALLGTGNWQWQVNGAAPNFIIKDASGSNTNSITINLGTNPCALGGTFAFTNITGNNTASNSFNIAINTVSSGAVNTTTTTGTVLFNGQPLKMGSCSFDIAKCNTIPHQVREDLETFLTTAGTRAKLQASSTNLTSVFNFGFNLRNQLANNYQSYTGTTAITTNTLFYYWTNTTPAASTNTLLTGAFSASTLSTGPSTILPSACSFSLQFANPGSVASGHNLGSPTAYVLSNFILAAGPTVNSSVYNFSITATFGSTSYILLGASSCFGMRSCGECVSQSSGSVSTVGASVINSFPCTGAPSFTIMENVGGATTMYTNVANCAVPNSINSLQYTIGSSVLFNDGLHTNWAAYAGDNGTSLFMMHATGNEFAYKQNYTPLHTCPNNGISVKVHNKTGGSAQVYYTDFKIRINGSLISSSNVTSAPVYYSSTLTPWTEFTASNISTTAGVPILFEIVDLNNMSDLNFAIDDIQIKPLDCTEGNLPCVASMDTIAPFPEVEYEDPCVQYALDIADNDAQELYNAYIDSMKTAFIQGYIQKCMGNAVENMHLMYNSGDYHYTLYYYDQAGNLVRTVPPEGVYVETNPANLAIILSDRANNVLYTSKGYYTSHALQTTYTYNSLNQLVKQETPDAGISYFWYDALGRLVASQNAKQRAQGNGDGDNYYSYTRYDYLGRIAEVGQMDIGYDFVAMSLLSIAPLLNPVTNDYPNNLALVKTEVTNTYYGDDATYTALLPGSQFTAGSQQYLRSRVASVTIEDVDDGVPATYNHATHYSYDVHGNVKELVQENPDLVSFIQSYKKINYQYDLISGKVNCVAYQPGKPDMFLHKYEYDADNRITNVFTSKDGMIWDRDAKYFYYLHGPMARTEIGQDKVQGVDYAYTLHGWIKGVNSNILNPFNDIGKDAYKFSTGNINSFNGTDIFSYSLTYYEDKNTGIRDYTAINGVSGNVPSDFLASVYPAGLTQTPDLFNGNIRQMATSYSDANPLKRSYYLKPLLRNFNYDQLNRITGATSISDNIKPDNSWGNINISDIYNENFRYDQNGNILSAVRNGDQNGNLQMDDLYYNYIPNSNKLDYVKDGISGDPYTTDISSQSGGNYNYDEIGNLIADVSENIGNIDWTVYGKIKKITKGTGTIITFNYDASGNRISKTVFDGSTHNITTTYYVRDAQGNTMAVYERLKHEESETLSLKEQHIYGSSRLGICLRSIDPRVTPPVTNYYTRELSYKDYELNNHLGNVIATVTDRRIAVDDNRDGRVDYYTGEVINATDYYSFGSPMPGRNFNSTNYRYGFNGKENDPETVGTGSGTQDYGMRIYNPALGRFLSTDPLSPKFPFYTPYQFAGNLPTSGIDLDGLEYLDYREVRIKFISGEVHLNLENMNSTTRNAWKARDASGKWPNGQLGYPTKVTEVQYPDKLKSPDLVYLDNDYSYSSNPALYGESNKILYGAPNKKDGTPDMRYKGNKLNKSEGGATPVPEGKYAGTARGLAVSAALVNVAMWTFEQVQGFNLVEDMNLVDKHLSLLRTEVTQDINAAISKGIIPSQYMNSNDLAAIASVVLSGSNPTQNKEIHEIGMRIVREISKNDRTAPAIKTGGQGSDVTPSDNTQVNQTVIIQKVE